MLSTDRLQRMFYRQLSPIYEDGTLESWGLSDTRNPQTGTFPYVRLSTRPCKIQQDTCTEAQRTEAGYSGTDVRFLILQHKLAISPNDDSRITYRSQSFRVMSVGQDPARAYWDIRARLNPDAV